MGVIKIYATLASTSWANKNQVSFDQELVDV
jgi:hypothetical protein